VWNALEAGFNVDAVHEGGAVYGNSTYAKQTATPRSKRLT
jgi:hypothetical protein